MTHIVISIKDIEKQIELLTKQWAEEKLAQPYPDENQINYLTHELDFLNRLRRTPTQISLDEKSIEEKALKAIRETSMIIAGRKYRASDIQLGYEQALKDLI